jgi:phage gp29-like protein
MSPFTKAISALKSLLGRPVATRETDPEQFFNALQILPNPDKVLRQMGRAEEVYQSIMADPHVLGDIRSIRGQFRSMKWRIVCGDEDDANAQAAHELCEQWITTTPPNQVADWLEVMWQMTASILTGYAIHEVVWDVIDGKYLPSEVVDRPNRRIKFGMDSQPLLISRGKPNGEAVQPYQFIVSRNMASTTNPYGIALLSSCYWAKLFKDGGWRYFVKYCERHGLPWPVGRYPQGTADTEQAELAAALANMIEAGYLVAPEGTGIELLVPSSSGSGLPQENLIDRANREMSKALTGQAMTAELQGVGARAASETAHKRQESINDADRDIAASGMGRIFEWITRFNFGDGVAPPKLEFYEESKAGKDRAETYQLAANMGARPSKSAMLEELGIPQAEDDEDALLPGGKSDTPEPTEPPQPGQTKPEPKTDKADFSAAVQLLPGFTFAKAAGMSLEQAIDIAAEATDAAIERSMIAPVAEMLAQFEAEGKTLDQFQEALGGMFGAMDQEGLMEIISASLQYAALRGVATKAD